MSKTILLADDSLTIQKVVELTFMEEDYQVVAVGNGDEAVARLAELEPAMVVADVHMPGASGYEVCRQAKQAHPGVPVLLLVGTFEPFDDAVYQASGADGILKKPFDSQELLRLAGEMVGRDASGTEAAAEPAQIEPTVEPAAESDAAEPDTAEMEPPELPAPDLAMPEETEGDLPGSAIDQATAELRVGDPGKAGIAFGAEPEPELPAAVEASPAPAPPEAPPAAPPEPLPRQEPAAAPPVAGAAAEAEAATSGADEPASLALSDEDVDRIARRVVELLGDSTVREVTWDVVPDLAEIVIKDRLKELESQVD